MIGIIEDLARTVAKAYPADGGPMDELRSKLAELDAERERLQDLVDVARDRHCAGSDNEVEIDEPAFFSEGDDGTWVSAWVFLPKAASEEEDDEDQDR